MDEAKTLLNKSLSPVELAVLKDLDFPWDSLEAFVEADISPDQALVSTTILCFPATLVLVRWEPKEMKRNGLARLGRDTTPHRSIENIHEIPRTAIRELRIDNQVIGGLLVADIDLAGDGEFETIRLAHFTAGKHKSMANFLAQWEGRDVSEEIEETHCPSCGRPYPQGERKFCPYCLERGSIFRRLVDRFLQKPGPVILFFLMLVAEGILHSVIPWITGTGLYDIVLGQDFSGVGAFAPFLENLSSLRLLFWLLVALTATRIFQSLTSLINGRITSRLVPGVIAGLRAEAFGNLQQLSLAFFSHRQTGSLLQRINQDADEVTVFFTEELPYFIFNVMTLLGSVYFMFQMNAKLAVLGLFLLPPTFIISFIMLPRLQVVQSQRSSSTRRVYDVLNDTMQGARVLRAFGQEEEQGRRFEGRNTNLRDSERNVVLYQLRFQLPYYITRFLPQALIWSVGAWMIFQPNSQLSYGELISFTVYLNLLQEPLTSMSQAFIIWSNSMNAAQRVFEIIDAEADIQEVSNPISKELEGKIEFKNVNFSYEVNKRILKDINFTLEPGEMVGMVGRSGAGKSTFVNLIARLYDVDDGEVLLDGVNVKDLTFKSLRGQVGMVSQESYIFMGSVSENIAYGRPDASRDDVVEAAIAAHAHPFISHLPDGYDTLVGTGYRDLSGGEKQRVSIARAILMDPKILVLDEATSSVDTETERAIQNALDELVKDRSTISIAHRLSTLRDADRIIVLDGGEIVEIGTQDELLAMEGEYERLYRLQTEALSLREEAELLLQEQRSSDRDHVDDEHEEDLNRSADSADSAGSKILRSKDDNEKTKEFAVKDDFPKTDRDAEKAGVKKMTDKLGSTDSTRTNTEHRGSGPISTGSEDRGADIVQESLLAIEEKIQVRKLDPTNAVFRATPGGFVSVEIDGHVTPRIQVHRCFPFSAPDEWISIRKNNENDGELGLIESLSAFDAETRKLLDEQLELRYFMPVITKIHRVKEEYGYSYWDVETDRGDLDFVMQTRSSSIMRLSAVRIIIIDIDGNRYEIPDLTALPTTERRRIEMYV